MKITDAQLRTIQREMEDLGSVELLPLLDAESRLGYVIARLHFGDDVYQDLEISSRGTITKRILRDTV